MKEKTKTKRTIKKPVFISLKSDERKKLKKLVTKGSAKAREIRRGNVLLMSDSGKAPKEISETLEVNKRTIQNIKERYLQGGIDNALYEKPRPGAPTIFDGKVRAKITSLACTEAPEGYAKWSLRLLAEKVVELKIVNEISHNHIGLILKKTK